MKEKPKIRSSFALPKDQLRQIVTRKVQKLMIAKFKKAG